MKLLFDFLISEYLWQHGRSDRLDENSGPRVPIYLHFRFVKPALLCENGNEVS